MARAPETGSVLEIEAWGFELRTAGPDDFRLLDPLEQARANRFHYERHRVHYVSAHATVRRILGDRLGLAPQAVPITRTPLGKPVLGTHAAPAVDGTAPPLHFNLSHCDDIGWLAIAPVPVGIDVERIRDLDELLPLIQSHCTSDEIDSLIALPAAERAAAFLRIWTRKEAVLKAWGTGIGEIELHTLAVGLAADRIPAIGPPERFAPLRVHTERRPATVLSIAAATPLPLRCRLTSASSA